MKLFVALGPGDCVAAVRAQINGGKITPETSIILSGQLFEYCHERNIEMLALSHNRRFDTLRVGPLQLENRPPMFEGARGMRYHFLKIVRALYLAIRARRFVADLAIIDSGSAHYFALAVFRLLGIPVAINFHNTLWPSGFEPNRIPARLVRSFDAWFFRWVVVATSGVSPECRRQVQQLAGRPLPFFEYRSQFRTDGFSATRRGGERNPFRIIFVGRVERYKGVLDVVAMAERLRGRSRVPILFDICGDGAALPELRSAVQERGLDDTICIHGRLARPELLQVYARAHAVIVPTRGDFCEGLPQVCSEAVLSGIPIITSRLSNALPVLGAAILEAEPENIESYVGAIQMLAEDRATYDRLCDACPELSRQFLDRSQSYPAAIDRLIGHLFPSWKPLNDYESLFSRIA